MKVTDKVIMDLMPLYLAGEASEDTTKLVQAYLEEHPRFARTIEQQSMENLIVDIPRTLKPEDEMMILNKTKKLLSYRNFFLMIGIFCSLLSFAFGDVSWSDIEGVHWLWSEYPAGALISGLIGLVGWAGYFMIRNRLRTTAL